MYIFVLGRFQEKQLKLPLHYDLIQGRLFLCLKLLCCRPVVRLHELKRRGFSFSSE